MEGVVAGSERACKGEEESKVLEVPRADCGLGNRCQRNSYSICKVYVHGEGCYRVQPSLRGRGGVEGPGDAARRLWVEQQVLASTYSIFKRTYVERGCHGVRASLQGGGRVQSPSEPMDGARAL
jgi:hypothetical protein